jgi:hypothetical protein
MKGWLMNEKKLEEWELAGETDVLEYKPAIVPLWPPKVPIWSGIEPGKPETNRLSYGVAASI